MSFVAERQFIIATRETGYRTTSSAIAELVDNAVQAGARHVEIRTRNFERNAEDEPGVAVLDDGAGMDPRLLALALRFGGTERFDDRSGLGRFGMGLPNSSVSQARRVDVYSWRSPRKVFHSYFDVDEIAEGTLTDVPDARPATVPTWISDKLPKSGTAVVWSKCDRLSARRVETFRDRIAADLGRSFRYFLADGLRLAIDGTDVTLVDPLFCDSRAPLGGQATEVGKPLVYEVASPRSPGVASTVRVRFSLLPIRRWSELSIDDKRRLGISKAAGVSVVRAGREIAYGWYFMGQKRKENYDDWWRCEVHFEPELDELFGVTHSKQGIRPSADLEAVLMRDLEAIAHDLNRRVRKEFTELKATEGRSATKLANAKERFLAPLKKGVPLATSNGHGVNYRVSTRALQQRRFFSSAVSRGRVSLTINKNHPFFDVYAAHMKNGAGADVRFAIDCLLLAIARAEHGAKTQAQRDTIRNCFETWSNNLATFLRK
jgi:hypothetical protein